MSHEALVLGSNYYIGLSTMRCLGKEGVHVVGVDYEEKDSYAFKSKYCHQKLIVPHYKKEEEAFIKALITYAKTKTHKPVLLPCADPYVEVTDRHRDQLIKVFLMPGMPQGLQTSLLEKDTLADHCQRLGMKTPETIRVTDDIDEARILNEIGFPCLVKPANSHAFVARFRKKMFRVQDMAALKEAVNEAKEAQLEVFIQRIIPGFDDHMYTYDAYLNEDSQVTHWLSCQKHRQYPINYGASVYTSQFYEPQLHEIGKPFLEAVGYKGFAEIEFKKDAHTGVFYLIEINTRFSNLNQLLADVGINMPYITYRELTGTPLEPHAITTQTKRVFWYTFEDLLAVKGYVKSKQLSLFSILVSYFKKKSYAIWDPKDQAPYWDFMRQFVKKVFRTKKR